MCVYCLQVIDVASAQQSSVQHETTGPYALPNDETADKVQKVSILYNTYVRTYVVVPVVDQ